MAASTINGLAHDSDNPLPLDRLLTSPALKGPAPLKELADSMILDGSASDPAYDSDIPAGYTYFGQFVAHDLSRDPAAGTPPGDSALPSHQVERPYLWLDPMYGASSKAREPYMDGPRQARFRLGWTTKGTSSQRSTQDDLYRIQGQAQIPDPRNDDNLPLAQMHLLFQKFHNKAVDQLYGRSGVDDPFQAARGEVVRHYQWLIVDDYLRRVLSPEDFKKYVVDRDRTDWAAGVGEKLYKKVPAEFAGAAFRFGHSMPRSSYRWVVGASDPVSLLELFRQTGRFEFAPDTPRSLAQGKTLGADWPIDWRLMFDIDPAVTPNPARLIDTMLSSALGSMRHSGGTNLAQRTLDRGLKYRLGSGQELLGRFKSLGVSAISPSDMDTSVGAGAARRAVFLKHPDFRTETPLWFYLLREAEFYHQGKHLGPLGGFLVANVLLDLIAASRAQPVGLTILKADRALKWCPGDSFLGIAPKAKRSIDPLRPSLTLADIVRFVG